MRSAILLAASLAFASSLSAQQHLTGGTEGKRPIGWQVRYDAGEHAGHGADAISFVQMTPGVHVATAGQRCTSVLLRNDGKFLVKQRTGEQLTTLTDWTAQPDGIFGVRMHHAVNAHVSSVARGK